jgi:hypothetical protein
LMHTAHNNLCTTPLQPPTLRVFSNWDVIRVIIPRAAMKLSRFSTCAREYVMKNRFLHLKIRLS